MKTKKTLSLFLLFFTIALFIFGCRTKQPQTKYGVRPNFTEKNTQN